MPKSVALLVAVVLLVVPYRLSVADEDKASTNKEIRYEVELPNNHWSYPCLAYSPDGKIIAAGLDNSVVFWDAATGEQLRRFETENETDHVYTLDFSPEGKFLATAGDNGSVIIWALSEKRISKTYSLNTAVTRFKECGNPDTAYTSYERANEYIVKFSPDGKTLATATRENVVLLEIDSGMEIIRMDYYVTGVGPDISKRTLVSSLSFNGNGSKLAVGLRHSVDIWDLRTGKVVQTLDGAKLGHMHAATITTVAFSPDGNKLFTYGFDHTTAMWDLDTGRIIWKVVNSNHVTSISDQGAVQDLCGPCHSGRNDLSLDALGRTLTVSPNGESIATGSKNNSIILRDSATGERTKTFTAFDDGRCRLFAVDFSQDGDSIAVLFKNYKSGRLIVYNANYDAGPEAELNNRILDLIDERDTKINLAYINKPEKGTEATAERIRKEYDALIEKEKAAFEAEHKAAEPAVKQVPVPEK